MTTRTLELTTGAGLSTDWPGIVREIREADLRGDRLEAAGDLRGCREAWRQASERREAMWATPAPNLRALAWKLENAIAAEGGLDEGSTVHIVLRDLRALVG